SMAAGADNLLVMPSPARPTILRRLPPDFEMAAEMKIGEMSASAIVGLGEPDNYIRHEGGLLSRALGNAVHKLLEQLSRLRVTLDWNSAREALKQRRPRIINS